MKRAPMPDHPRRLEESYRVLAVPAGSQRYWSWLFAAPPMRDPLLGIYALLAEWRGLVDPAIEPAAAHLKLAWWREEIERLGRGAPLHPIGRFIASLPRAGSVDFTPLEKTLEAAARLAGELAPDRAEDVHRAEAALAAAEYLNDAIASYQRAALFGRVAFPVDELLAANVEDADLRAAEPPLHLQSYLEASRRRAVQYGPQARAAPPAAEHAPMRHLLVLAALGARQASGRRNGLHSL